MDVISHVCVFVWLGKIFNMFSLIFSFVYLGSDYQFAAPGGVILFFSRARDVVGGASPETSKPVQVQGDSRNSCSACFDLCM